MNKRIHKPLEINYNFPSKVYEKSKVRSIDLNIFTAHHQYYKAPDGSVFMSAVRRRGAGLV